MNYIKQNREIKFRVYSTKMKEMVDWDVLKTKTDLGSVFSYEYESLIPMQYTGLHDKNGKEIYQSDILNIDGVNVPVEWYNGAWTVEYFVRPRRSYLSTFDETDVEIIGNIYENTDLLTKENK